MRNCISSIAWLLLENGSIINQISASTGWFNTVPKANFHVGLNLVLTNVDTTRGNVPRALLSLSLKLDSNPLVIVQQDAKGAIMKL